MKCGKLLYRLVGMGKIEKANATSVMEWIESISYTEKWLTSIRCSIL
jgi:hypothetical protein